MLSNIIHNTTPWVFDHGIKIVAIIIVAYLISKFSGIFIEKIIRKIIISSHFLTKEAEKKREAKSAFMEIFYFPSAAWCHGRVSEC